MQKVANCAIPPIMNTTINTLTACPTNHDILHHNFNDKCNSVNNATKPKIWSLAETATEDKPKSPLSHTSPTLGSNMNIAPSLHLSANLHPNPSPLSATPVVSNMSGWCHPTHAHQSHNPYTTATVSPYGTHYMSSFGRHFTHQSSATSLPPQADTPPHTPPALKLASMQLLSSESGALAAALGAHEQVNCAVVESPKLITFGNRGEQVAHNGNTSPPTHSTQIYANDFRMNANRNLSESGDHLFTNSIGSGVLHQTQDNNSNNTTNHK
ncbi:uncharacterized protein LOC128962675 [Oppia nitens]|uniref:uncharacterized protein LOC128962675 n=1 Tax=Oppia nitens TaxID=1686743 RepID=UPI0023DB4CFD|nr:uncharacterized protein LOC128962675 [Oppia nitens]